jgi:hypothetical protein
MFPVFWWLPTMDVWPECSSYHIVGELEHARLFSVYGRPGFHAYFVNAPKDKIQDAESFLILLLEAKIAGRNDKLELTQDASSVLGAVGVRTALTVTASCKVASELVASHMRQCVGVSEDRESVFSFQYAEPALALAALRLVYKFGWNKVIDFVRNAMAETFTDAGYRGELGAQLLLLMIADHCIARTLPLHGMESITTIPTIPLKIYLEALTGKDKQVFKNADDIEQRISCMHIRLIQFVQFFSIPDSEQLTQMFNRAVGIVAKVGTEYVDIIIPVLVVGQHESVVDVKVEPIRMTVLLIQVKCQGKTAGESIQAELCCSRLPREGCLSHPFNNDLDYISLFMEMSSFGAPFEAAVFTREKVLEFRNTLNAKRQKTGKPDKEYPHLDPRQISVAVTGARPSHVLEESAQFSDLLDSSFQRLLQASFNPKEIKGNTPAAIKNLDISMSLLYNSGKPALG